MTFRFRFFLSQKVHLMCYRICARSLSAIITYHNRCVMLVTFTQHLKTPKK